MLVTEAQAGAMWCPQSHPHATVRPGEPNPSRCVGAHCMAWRWGDPAMNLPPNPDSYVSEDLKGNRGYCGLAGKPLEVEP